MPISLQRAASIQIFFASFCNKYHFTYHLYHHDDEDDTDDDNKRIFYLFFSLIYKLLSMLFKIDDRTC